MTPEPRHQVAAMASRALIESYLGVVTGEQTPDAATPEVIRAVVGVLGADELPEAVTLRLGALVESLAMHAAGALVIAEGRGVDPHQALEDTAALVRRLALGES